MMSSDKKTLLPPILLIMIGTGWLFTALGLAPGIDWIWTLGLAAVGLSVIATCGIDKVTVVIGPLFLLASGLSILRQMDRIRFEIEVPVLMIAAGILFLLARSRHVPAPAWIVQDDNSPPG